ncbi:PD-(D/E)XK nuclease family protein [Chloroflexota bacterium]
MKYKQAPYNCISDVIYIENRPLFPISWLQKQDFCEYQIFLENIKGIKVKPTPAMIKGSQGHTQLYNEFKKEAVPATLEEMLDESKTGELFSREFKVKDLRHGVYGLVDEVWMTPDEFIVIDDKPGTKAYLSNIHQTYGYCLAFKEVVSHSESRQVIAALRERGTSNIYWSLPFDESAEEEIVSVITRIHSLLAGNEEFDSSDNPNKCNACRFKSVCERIVK